MAFPTLLIGPVSKNIVDAAIAVAEDHNCDIGLIASRNQFDYHGGYVDGSTTARFRDYVRSKSPSIFLCRDHGGPGQTVACDSGIKSFRVDSQYMDFVHIDPWKIADPDDFEMGIDLTLDLLKQCYQFNQSTLFEVGTEEAIYPYAPEQLDRLLSRIKSELPVDLANNVKYACIQSGVGLDLLNSKNTGTFDPRKFEAFIRVCESHNVRSKEHNGDFLTWDDISERFKCGLSAINVAPELGQVESRFIWEQLRNGSHFREMSKFYSLCVDYAPWRKWLPAGFEPNIQHSPTFIRDFCIAFGHYVFNHPEFKKIKVGVNVTDIELRQVLTQFILQLYAATNPH